MFNLFHFKKIVFMHVFPLMKTYWKMFPSNIFSVENCDSLNPNILSLSVTPNSYTQIGLRFEKILALHFTTYTSTYFLYFLQYLKNLRSLWLLERKRSENFLQRVVVIVAVFRHQNPRGKIIPWNGFKICIFEWEISPKEAIN